MSAWPPKRRDRPLVVLLPKSILSDSPTLREKTVKVGLIARALAIFRVDEVDIYDDGTEGSEEDIRVFLDIARYMLTPPYLKRRLHKLKETLRYAGLLPPLTIPSHPASPTDTATPYREAVVLRRVKGGVIVDAGLEKPSLIKNYEAKPGERLTVRIQRAGGGVKLKPVKRVPVYWGFKIRITTSLKERLNQLRSQGYSLIGTSRKGLPLRGEVERLRRLLKKPAAVMFGSPKEGIYEIMNRLNMNPEKEMQTIINFIPNQGVRTVRTEEAIYIVLGIINTLT